MKIQIKQLRNTYRAKYSEKDNAIGNKMVRNDFIEKIEFEMIWERWIKLIKYDQVFIEHHLCQAVGAGVYKQR